MAISIRCNNPDCGKTWRVKDKHAGRLVQCPTCGQPMRIPLPQPPSLSGVRAEEAAHPAEAFPPRPVPEGPARRAIWPWLIGAAALLVLAVGTGYLLAPWLVRRAENRPSGPSTGGPAAVTPAGSDGQAAPALTSGPVRASAQVVTDRGTFEGRLGAPPRLVNFDDIETPEVGHVPFAADRYRAQGVVITGQGEQYVSREFGYPGNYKCVSAPNMYAPGPAAARGGGKNDGGHETTVTFVDAAGNPAAVAGFGCFFIDCNYPDIGPSSIEAFDKDGRSLRVEQGFKGATGSHLFFGILTADDAGRPVPAIARVRLVNGSCFPEVYAGEGVALDDFVFSAPQPAVAVNLTGGGPVATAPPAAAPSAAAAPAPARGQPLLGESAGESKTWRWADPPPPAGEPRRLKMPDWARGKITDLALSSDGKTLATVTGLGEYALWDLGTGEAATLPLRSIGPHQQPGGPLAFGADGTTLLTATDQGIVVWDVARRSATAVLQDPDKNGKPAWYGIRSDDGRAVVTYDYTGSPGRFEWVVHELPSGKWLVATPYPEHGLDVALSADGRTFAVSEWEGVRLFDVATGRPREGIRGLEPVTHSLALSADGSLLMIGDNRDKALTLWDIQDPAAPPRLRARLPEGSARGPALSPDAKAIAFTDGSNFILWDVASGAPRGKVAGSYSARFSRNNRVLIADRTVADVGTVRVLTVVETLGGSRTLSDDGLVMAQLEGGTAVVRSLAPDAAGGGGAVLAERAAIRYTADRPLRAIGWSPNGRFLALDTTLIRVLDLRTGAVLPQDAPIDPESGLGGSWGFLNNHRFATTGSTLGGRNITIGVLDLDTGQARRSVGPGLLLARCAVAPDGRTLAAVVAPPNSEHNWMAVLTTAENFDHPSAVLLKGDENMLLAVGPDGKRLAVAQRGAVHLFSMATGKEEPTTAAHADRGLVFRDGGNALVCWDQEKFYVYDLTTGQQRHEQALGDGHVRGCLAAAVHPTRPLFVTTGEQGDLLVKDLTTGKIRQRVALGPHPARFVSFSPDGKLLIACLCDRERKPRAIKVWSVAE